MTAATTPPFTFHIDIYADTVCIWSYIGHKLLERAIETYKTALSPDDRDKVTFNLTWRPYVLYPDAGVSIRTKKEAMQKIYSLNAPEIFLRIDSLTKENNIPLTWQGTTGNSINSHKLILLAIEQDSQSQSLLSSPTPLHDNSDTQSHQQTKQYQVVSTIFQEAWQLSTDISAPSNLARIAVSTGLFPCEAKAASYLENSEAATEAVHASSAYGKSIGVSAVPSYVVNGRWQVGGMQDVDMWLELLGRVRHVSSAST